MGNELIWELANERVSECFLICKSGLRTVISIYQFRCCVERLAQGYDVAISLQSTF